MRRFLAFLAIGAAGFLALCVVVLAFLMRAGIGLDAQAKAYAQSSVTAIVAHWNPQELRGRATESLNSTVQDQKLSALFVWFRSLGDLVGDEGCQGGTTVYKFAFGGQSRTTGRYRCLVVFRHGRASIDIDLVEQAGRWRIEGFRVNSDALLPNPPAEKI